MEDRNNMTQVGDRIKIFVSNGVAVEARIQRILPGGQAEAITAEVYEVRPGYQTNVFIVEAVPAYQIVRAI
jgi:hypothetical protein